MINGQSAVEVLSNSAMQRRSRMQSGGLKVRESIHMQKLEIDSNISKDAIRLMSSESKQRQTREVVLSHRHE
jgi:hypothetical protein